MERISVVIPTKNEENDLPRCLKSLSFADDIVIVDQHSTDNTVAIAKRSGARIFTHDTSDFAAKRNLGDKKAKHDWVLSIDADVEVPKDLIQEIKALPDYPAAYKIGRVNIILKRPMFHSDWGPADDNHIRLYHKSLGSWQGSVHEQFVSSKRPQQLHHHLLHYNIDSISEFLKKSNHYSTLASSQKRATYFSLFLDPARDFFKRFFYKLGFLDGLHGLFFSYLQAIYYFSVNIKVLSSNKKS